MAGAATQHEPTQRTQNVRVVIAKNEPSPEYKRAGTGPTFEATQSMEALARSEKSKGGEAAEKVALAEVAANEAQYRQREEIAYRARAQAMAVAQGHLRSRGTVQTLKKINPVSWAGLGIAFTLYIWQLIFALFAAFGLLIKSGQVALEEGNVLEKAAGFLLSFPASGIGELGILAWGIEILISIGGFIAFFVWFKLQGINPLQTTGSTFWTFLLLALNMIPIINIFPWLMIWIIYVNISSFGRELKTLKF